MNVYLIGYRGTGKTTVAKILAARGDFCWLDTDQEIERRTGKTIAQIFADDGEGGFRDLESAVVAELSRRDRLVLALGGGAVLREENRRAIGSGTVIWLQASAETIFARISADAETARRRPNLTPTGGLQEIRELLLRRAPIYRQCTNFAVDTEGKSPEQVAQDILELLG
jgi:shikimate kinase